MKIRLYESLIDVLLIIGVGIPLAFGWVLDTWRTILKPMDPIVLLLPYAVLIPFAGRVSYYRRWSAHMATFLNVYAEDMRRYTKFASKVKIETSWFDKILAWLVNYELGFLAITVMIFFYIKYPKEVSDYIFTDWFIMVIPAIATAFVFALLKSVRNYDKMKEKYKQIQELQEI